VETRKGELAERQNSGGADLRRTGELAQKKVEDSEQGQHPSRIQRRHWMNRVRRRRENNSWEINSWMGGGGGR